ncbi:NAD-dependent epimerase/dehydratase family protein [Rhodovarius crocodyli]|uniref:NAD-dependent epimerase/dehydratase family protein n=1 Tax=Rhodovarius crocodyli TaxID=1979269 RepID=A0A437MGR6_9PROT|nr:NAD-dependent epimerase/dehydratase family protein [Rhodovarius crocodyli]RVT96850.1 NAD-dependent epimerase/dehydratase family protein [Rhodovarius crocodyli]
MRDTVLVTGGTGFIASWAIVSLLRQGYAVRTTIREPGREAAVRQATGAAMAEPGDRLTCVVADLTRDDGWDSAMAGCRHVLHIASPLGREAPSDRDALVGPARDGTLRVLRAAVAAGVERVVMTSAAATARERGSSAVSTEAIWADPEDPLLDPYRRSKILAERAAWDFMAGAGNRTSLTTILPGAVFGPLLPGVPVGSVWMVKSLLEGKPPRLLNLGLSVVDVRDLAEAHVAALTAPAAPGERFLCTGHFLWMPEVAAVLRQGLGARGARVPDKVLPDWLVGPLSWVVPRLRMFRHDIGQRREADNGKARAVLGFDPRPAAETLLDCARSL